MKTWKRDYILRQDELQENYEYFGGLRLEYDTTIITQGKRKLDPGWRCDRIINKDGSMEYRIYHIDGYWWRWKRALRNVKNKFKGLKMKIFS